MRSSEIENWALRVIRQVESGQPNEDSRVELKAEWPDAAKAARRIAGHANAAHGEPILWLIGVDEQSGVVKIENRELANWFGQVQAEFEELSPQLVTDLNIPVGDDTVVALLFETDRAPYLVRNPSFGKQEGGPVQSEVPWREARSVRTANRSDLLMLLSPMQRLPSFELLDASLMVRPELVPGSAGGQVPSGTPKYFTWELQMDFYVVPKSQDRVVIPFHRCQASLVIPGCRSETELESVALKPRSSLHMEHGHWTAKVDSLTIDSTRYEVLIDGSGHIRLQGKADLPKAETDHESIQARVSLRPVDAALPISFSEVLQRTSPDLQKHEIAAWKLSPDDAEFD